MFSILGVVSALLLLHTDYSEAVCGNMPVIWRNDNITCPPRAVCGDVFNSVRDWYNGTVCEETRTLSNCLCAGGTVCPTNNPAHGLFSSRTHKQYLCEPTCRLPWCGNIRVRPRDTAPVSRRRGGHPRRAITSPVAVTVEQRAQEFNYKNYYKLSCRCPRHFYPSDSRRNRAVKASGSHYIPLRHRYRSLFTCDVTPSETHIEDPCS